MQDARFAMNGSVPDTAQLTLAADNKQERRSKLLILRFGRDPQREELQRVKLGSRQAKLPTNRDELTGVWEAEDDFSVPHAAYQTQADGSRSVLVDGVIEVHERPEGLAVGGDQKIALANAGGDDGSGGVDGADEEPWSVGHAHVAAHLQGDVRWSERHSPVGRVALSRWPFEAGEQLAQKIGEQLLVLVGEGREQTSLVGQVKRRAGIKDLGALAGQRHDRATSVLGVRLTRDKSRADQPIHAVRTFPGGSRPGGAPGRTKRPA